jgi:hypothetical protein
MKKIGNIVRYTAEEIDELRKNGGSKTDWAKADAMTEEELEASIAADPDDFSGGIAVYAARDFDGIVLSDLGAEKWTQCRIARDVLGRRFARELTVDDCVRVGLDNASILADIYRSKPSAGDDKNDAGKPILISLSLEDIQTWEATAGKRLSDDALSARGTSGFAHRAGRKPAAE